MIVNFSYDSSTRVEGGVGFKVEGIETSWDVMDTTLFGSEFRERAVMRVHYAMKVQCLHCGARFELLVQPEEIEDGRLRIEGHPGYVEHPILRQLENGRSLERLFRSVRQIQDGYIEYIEWQERAPYRDAWLAAGNDPEEFEAWYMEKVLGIEPTDEGFDDYDYW